MKILLATINYTHPQRGMEHAFKTIFGADNVLDFDYRHYSPGNLPATNQRFVELCKTHQPDWVWMQLQDTGVITASAIVEARRVCPRAIFTHWTGDARPTISPYLASICKVTDVTYASTQGHLGRYQEAGARRARYLQIGLDWHEDVLGARKPDIKFRVPEVVFCGGYYGSAFPEGTRAREAAIRALQAAKLDVGIVGPGWPRNFPVVGTCHVKEQVHIYQRAKVALNVNHFNTIARYYSDRQLIAMVSGTPLVCHYIPGLELEFRHGEHCYWYSTEAELVEYVKALLAEPELARRIGQAGRAEVVARHTWQSRILSIMPEIEALTAG